MNIMIEVQIKNHFGNERIYPVNEAGKKLARMVGSKTFTRETIALAKELGFNFEVKKEEI
tara:strand:+ start:138 stop:317 length:180 start_codon:yes stop_codon:yes gene_type:complete